MPREQREAYEKEDIQYSRISEAMEEKRQEGRAKGLAEGLAEGKAEERRQVALKMLKENLYASTLASDPLTDLRPNFALQSIEDRCQKHQV